MRLLALFAALAATLIGRADCELPVDYKKKIEAALASQYPQYAEFFCEFYAPKRVLVGPEKQERCAVPCGWGAKLKSGDIPLMIVRSVFIFDGERVEELKGHGPFVWPDGEPVWEKEKKPNQASERNVSARHASCGARVTPVRAVAHL
jgi:hypothetical protein